MPLKYRWMPALTALGLACQCCPAAGAPADTPVLPEIAVPVCPAPPFLDGALTDSCWQTATVISNLLILQKPDETAAHKVCLARDKEWLYVAVSAVHPAPQHIKRSVYEQDGSVQTDDAIEMFIDPGSAGNFYLHYCLNAANIKSDQLILNSGERDRQARMPWRSAVRQTETGWNAELAFPFQVMVRETRYHRQANMKMCDWSRARLNVCVNTVKPVFDAYGARMAEERQFAAWAPLAAGYHEPERFGWLKGLGAEQSARPGVATSAPLFWPWLENVRVGRYELRDGQPFYTLTAEIKNTAYGGGRVDVAALDQPAAGAAVEVLGHAALTPNQQQDLALMVPIQTPGRRTALVRLNDAIHGGTYETRLLSEQIMAAAEPFAAWLDRSYYTDEKNAGMVCRFRLPPSALAGQSAAVKDQTGQILAQSGKLAPECIIPVPLHGLAYGEHNLAIAWSDAGGNILAEQSFQLRKLPPNPGCEIKIDRAHGTALKDGRPILPFGLLQSGLTSQDDAYFKRMAEAGFNTVVWWGRDWRIDPREYGAWLETARRHGLMVVDACTAINPTPPSMRALRQSRGLKIFEHQKPFSEAEEVEIALQDFDRILPDLKKTWAIAARAPNLIGYYNVDEPNLGNQQANLQILERFYREIKMADPYRPCVNLFACHIPPGGQWTRWGDIFGYDPYIYPGWGRFDYGQPNFVAREVLELKHRIDSVHKGVWLVPIAFQMNPERTPRGLTAAEQHCQTYLALIHGARGLLYFSGNNCYAQAAWDALSGLAQQMKILGPAITAPAVPQRLEYQPNALDADKSVFPEVQAALFRHPDGRYVLLAANSRDYPVTAAFTVSGLQAPGWPARLLGRQAVENLFGSRPPAVNDNAFADEFESYGTRAYALEISESQAANPMFQITVRSAGHPEAAVLPGIFPVAEIRKRKNVIPNPSFAIQTVPGAPDYIRPNMYLDWPLAGAPGGGWGLDSDNPYHGGQSLRLVHRVKGGEPPDVNHRITAGVFYPPLMKESATYTFSLYARAARDGDELSVHIGSMTPQSPGGRWKLTREWKRYAFTGTLSHQGAPGAMGGSRGFFLYTWDKDAVIWIDALQMEEGAAPTAFTED